MEIVYKGGAFVAKVNLEEGTTLTDAWLYNLATRDKVEFSKTQIADTIYLIWLDSDDTFGLSVGLYNLELYDGDTLIDCKENYIKIIETSKSN